MCLQSWKESPRLEGITLAKPGCKPVFVPKLALPALASPKDPGECWPLDASGIKDLLASAYACIWHACHHSTLGLQS